MSSTTTTTLLTIILHKGQIQSVPLGNSGGGIPVIPIFVGVFGGTLLLLFLTRSWWGKPEPAPIDPPRQRENP